MIKIIQHLKESFLTYKINFKKIFWMVLPILVLNIVIEYYVSVFTTMIENDNFTNMSYLVLSIFIYIISILTISLYLTPVLGRTIQKKEDGDILDQSDSYAFQKKNLFKWIMVGVWGLLYMIRVMLPYIVTVAIIAIVTLTSNQNINFLMEIIILSLIGLILFTGIVLNINKFVFYKSIFFSKDEISAKEAVLESIKIGTDQKKQVWILLSIIIVFNIILFAFQVTVNYILFALTNFISINVTQYIQIVVYSVASILFFLPLILIVTSKGYVKIRG